MLSFSIYQGDSGLPTPVRPAISDPEETINNDWVCKTSLLGPDGSVIVPVRTESVKTDDNLYWLIWLKKEDTENVDIKRNFAKCTWVIQVTNDTLIPAYNREKHITVNVLKQGIPNG